jgi:hypothetical protein
MLLGDVCHVYHTTCSVHRSIGCTLIASFESGSCARASISVRVNTVKAASSPARALRAMHVKTRAATWAWHGLTGTRELQRSHRYFPYSVHAREYGGLRSYR